MLVPRQPRDQGMEELCPSGGSNLIFEVICPFHGSFALECLVWKGKSQSQAGIPVGAEHTQVWGWGVEETPRAAWGVKMETTRDFGGLLSFSWQGMAEMQPVTRFQMQELNLGPWNLEPEMFMGSLRILF